jgi:hypothetical protein
VPLWNSAALLTPLRRRGRAITAAAGGGPAAVLFDAGFAPVPQDVAFDNWTNSGWPRGPVPQTPTDGIEIEDFRQYVQMYVGEVGAEPTYYDHPADLNGSPSGQVQIRLGPSGGWRGANGSVETTYGTWINTDGQHLSYRPKPRPEPGGATYPIADDVDTQAQYRWLASGGTWSGAGTLKMTLVHPPSPVLFIDDYGVIFNNLNADNDAAFVSAIAAAEAGNLTLTQKSGANWAVWSSTETFGAAPTDTLHIYAVYARSEVPSPGRPTHRVFSFAMLGVTHDPFQLLFLDVNGRSGVQLAVGSDPPVVWDHISVQTDPEHHHFWHFGSHDIVHLPANRPTARVKYSMFYNSPSSLIHSWMNSDLRSQYCDHIGGFRGAHVNSGSNVIWRIHDSRVCNLLNNEGGFKLPASVYSEPERGEGTSIYRIERVLLNQGLALNTHFYCVETDWQAESDLQMNDLWMAPEWGAQPHFGPGMKVNRCRLNVTATSTGLATALLFVGSNLPGGQRIITDCEIVINNNPRVSQNTLTTWPSTQELGAGISWNPGSDTNLWDNAALTGRKPWGWTDRIVNTTVRIGEGLGSHTGAIYGFKLTSGASNDPATEIAKQGYLRLENVTFTEASDKQFTYAVQGAAMLSYPALQVYYAATAANNAALISPPPPALQRMWGPNVIATQIWHGLVDYGQGNQSLYYTIPPNTALNIPDATAFAWGFFARVSANDGDYYQYVLSSGTYSLPGSFSIHLHEAGVVVPPNTPHDYELRTLNDDDIFPNFYIHSDSDPGLDNELRLIVVQFDGASTWQMKFCTPGTEPTLEASATISGYTGFAAPADGWYVGAKSDLQINRFWKSELGGLFRASRMLTDPEIKDIARGASPVTVLGAACIEAWRFRDGASQTGIVQGIVATRHG